MNLNYFDILWLAIYFIAILVIGFYSSKEKFSFKSYTIGNKKFSNITMISTIAVTSIGGKAIFGTTEQIFVVGPIYLFVCFAIILSQIIMAIFIAPRVAKHDYATSLGDIMFKYYGFLGKTVTGFLGTVFSTAILAMQIKAMSYIFEYTHNINYELSLLISCFIIILYSTVGGIKSVINTDVLQFIILIIVIPIAANTVSNSINEIELIKLIKGYDTNFEYVYLFFVFLLPSISPPLIQRFLMARDSKQASKVMLVSALIHIPFYLFIAIIAIAAKFYNPDSTPNVAFFNLIELVFPSGLKGLIIAALIAIIMSTADSCLNVASTTFVKDFILPFKKKNIQDLTKVRLAKLFTIIIGIFAVVIALNFQNLLSIMLAFLNLWDPIVLVPFLAILLNLKPNKFFFITSIIIGFSSVILYLLFDIKYYTGFDAVFPCTILNAVIMFSLPIFKKISKNIVNLSLLRASIVKFINVLSEKSTRVFLEIKSKIKLSYISELGKFNDSNRDYFAIFMLLNYSMPNFLWNNNSLNNEIILLFRIGAISLCGLTLARQYLPNFLRPLYPIFWWISLTYTLVFIPIQLLLETSFNILNVINYMITALILSNIVSMRSSVIIMTIGTLLGYFSFKLLLISDSSNIINQNVISAIVFGYLGIVFSNLIFSKKQENLNNDKLQVIYMMGKIIAHEMRTPLLSIQANIASLDNNSYKLSKATKIIKRIKLITHNAMLSINMMLVNLNTELKYNSKICSISKIINLVLKEYPFSISEKNSLKLNKLKKDFKFYGDTLLVKNVFYNLIRNSIKQLNLKNSGNIIITIDDNTVIFEDNISGISKEVLKDLFKYDFYKSKLGTGLGLPYCKLVMESLGGDIECESINEKYTKFILKFPKVIE